MAKLTLQELESTLWQCADILRGELSGAEYKDYIFGMLFLKRLNDEFDEEREARKKEFLEDGLEEDEIEEAISEVNEDLKLAVAMETGIFDDTDEQNEDNDADNGINILEETNEIEENENSILMENEKDIQTESDKKDSTVKLDDDDDDDFVFVD